MPEQEYAELNLIKTGELPAGWEDALPRFTPEDKGLATRLHSQTMLNALANVLPGAPVLHTCPCIAPLPVATLNTAILRAPRLSSAPVFVIKMFG